jgi:hypothetical protein
MSQSDDLLAAVDDLAGAVARAALDGTYAPFRLQLLRAHQALTTQAWWIRADPGSVDRAPAEKAEAAVGSCEQATRALAGAGSYSERSEAISRTFEAIAAVNEVLPSHAPAFV